MESIIVDKNKNVGPNYVDSPPETKDVVAKKSDRVTPEPKAGMVESGPSVVDPAQPRAVGPVAATKTPARSDEIAVPRPTPPAKPEDDSAAADRVMV
jgi:hypothetical protein